MLEKSECNLKAKFSRLILHAIKKIKKKHIEWEDFATFMETHFTPTNCIPDSVDYHYVFRTISREKKWTHLSYYPLFAVLEVFVDEETEESRSEYEYAVTAYLAATKLPDWIRKNELCMKHAGPPLPSPNFDELSFKLDLKITEKSLKYVHDLWQKISKQFCLPPLNAVLHDIEIGCIRVAWHTPTNRGIKELIKEHIPSSEPFLKENNIILITFNEERLFPQVIN